jgi:hypothetical protein
LDKFINEIHFNKSLQDLAKYDLSAECQVEFKFGAQILVG